MLAYLDQWFERTRLPENDMISKSVYPIIRNAFFELSKTEIAAIRRNLNKIDQGQFIQLLLDIQKNQQKIKLSGMIMVKDQEERILSAVNSLISSVDELVVMDTGSTDQTLSKLKALKNNKLIIKQVNWIEDYALMRNTCKKFTTGNWLIYIDSDEILTTFKYSLTLKYVIALAQTLYKAKVKSLQLNVFANGSSSYILIDRIINNSDDMYFYGKVHEEPRFKYDDSDYSRIRTKIKVTNSGTSLDQQRKFNKNQRYRELLYEMLRTEPDNPRWLSFMQIDTALEDKIQLDKKILRFLLIDQKKPLSINNINLNKYTRSLIEKYTTYLFTTEKYHEALKVVRIARQVFPNNTDFLFLKYLIKKVQLDNTTSNLLDDLLSENMSLDHEITSENTQNNDDYIKVLTVKLLCGLSSYKKAAKVFSSISDKHALSMLKQETEVLSYYFK